MFIEKWAKGILIIKEYRKFIILNKKTPINYYNSEFIYIYNELSKRGIDNWLLAICTRMRQYYLILYIFIQNSTIWLYKCNIINSEHSFIFDKL